MKSIRPKINERIERARVIVKTAQLSQTYLSELTGIHQSQISRILSGQVRRASKNVILLCKFAEDLHNKNKLNTQIPSVLLHALEQTWDGSTHHADALAKVILSLNELSVNHAD